MPFWAAPAFQCCLKDHLNLDSGIGGIWWHLVASVATSWSLSKASNNCNDCQSCSAWQLGLLIKHARLHGIPDPAEASGHCDLCPKKLSKAWHFFGVNTVSDKFQDSFQEFPTNQSSP